MSGTKNCELEIEASVADALSACSTVARCAAATEAELQALQKVAQGASHAELQALETELAGEARAAQELLAETRSLLAGNRLSVTEADRAGQTARELAQRHLNLQQRARNAVKALGAEESTQALAARLSSQRERLRRWAPDAQQELDGRLAELGVQVNRKLREGAATKAECQVLEAVETRLSELLEEVAADEDTERRRQFVAEQIQQVAEHDLNHSCERRDPPPERPRDPIELVVHLGRRFGDVRFLLDFDLHLQSESRDLKVDGQCEGWVTDFADHLLDRGVEAQNLRYASGEPLRTRKAAKHLQRADHVAKSVGGSG